MLNTFLKANWENLIMANYEVDPSILKPFLPKGLELDFHNDKTYVSLVGFMFKKTSLFGIPIPFFGSFEEINLRFYVRRVEGEEFKKGVVFINETVPFKIVALLANKLYKEHYISIPTKNTIDVAEHKHINYQWKMKDKWNSITVQSAINKDKIAPSSIEEFIFERYYGFTKLSPSSTQEYRIHHPKWMTHKILNNNIDCDFGTMYGAAFSNLNNQAPSSIIVAEGSQVSVNWKRRQF
jgi:uncharacterized protein YqjF (DUF2071 family)